ncbi:hypothetical protein HZA38_04975 [Candidatus Peregrinibacteria bacterium]|nr:hypothetical protein [Candidatus Peregrinibacteria bacterium]
MSPNTKEKVEEIPADEVEVLTGEEKKEEEARITKIRADDPLPESFQGNPVQKMVEGIEEIKKIRIFGPAALIISFFGLKFFPFYFEPIAICLAILDLWMGSKYTKKISIAAIIFAILSLLNAWT